MQLRRIAIALGGSTAMVVLIAALIPRGYLVNDDAGIVLSLRMGSPTWMSPLLSGALAWAYQMTPGVPWYGLYLYALITVIGAVLFHTCIELIDHRRECGRVATTLGALMLVASHSILAIGVTWTTVSISALGTASVAFVAHLQTCQDTGTPASRLRALIYGLVFVAGFTLRDAAIAATAAALLPLLGWVGIRFLRARHLPRPTALIAFLAPFAIVVGIHRAMPPPPGAEYEEFNLVRGKISGAAAFGDLDRRAPELLARAGWTLDEYRDFSNWLLADDSEFSTAKVRKLADTGGVPMPMGLTEASSVVRDLATSSAASVWLFLTIVVGGILLAWIGVVDRVRVLWFGLGYLVFVTLVPVVMSAISRFPQRVALSFFSVAAFGMFVFLAGEIAHRPRRADTRGRPTIALVVISLFMLAWAQRLIAWTDRDAAPDHATLRGFADRVSARNGIVMVAIGNPEMDPLLADPRGFDALPNGWGTFTAPWYGYLRRFGISSGSELLHKMIDNPNAYLIATQHQNDVYLDWIRRRVSNPSVRLSLVDSAAGMPSADRPELYRLVTTPLARGSDEWRLQAARNQAGYAELAGPPETDRAFRSIELTAPYTKYVSPVHPPAAGIVVAPMAGGIHCTVTGVEACTDAAGGGEHAGIHIPVNGLRAARFDLTLIDSENIIGFYVYAQTESDSSFRWRWELDTPAQQFGYTGTFTLVPGYRAHQLELVDDTASARNIRELHVFIAVKPGTHAGFELRNVEVAEP